MTMTLRDMTLPLRTALAVLALTLLAPLSVNAEDIDLYTGLGGSGAVPNVLFILDNAADFAASAPTLTCNYADGSGSPSMAGTLAGIQQCALFNAVYSLPSGVM